MKKYTQIRYFHVSSIELQILLGISDFPWCFGYSPVSETGFSWSLAQCFPALCCKSQFTALDNQSWFGIFRANWGICMTWLTTNHAQQLRLMSMCPLSPACAPGLGLGLRLLHLQLEFTHLLRCGWDSLPLNLSDPALPATPNLIFSEHFTPRLSHFAMQALLCPPITSPLAGTVTSSDLSFFVFTFLLCSASSICVQKCRHSSQFQAYPTFVFSDSSYSLN